MPNEQDMSIELALNAQIYCIKSLYKTTKEEIQGSSKGSKFDFKMVFDQPDSLKNLRTLNVKSSANSYIAARTCESFNFE